ncbi:MAG: PD-(D/E)XK nuclease family protein [Firmicutes bacterium]|nr:PD-(D/E)XK nuclease family protein [Bacillota bacterium]
MNERFILAPGASGTELLRSLARHGVNTMGLRVLGAPELARTALMRSGITITERFLTSREEPSVIYSFLDGIGYFSPPSFSVAQDLAGALRTLRQLAAGDEEKDVEEALSMGEFPEKNGALLEVFTRYAEVLKSEGRIDALGVVRKALAEASPLCGSPASNGTELLCLKEFPLSPLERALAERLSGGSLKTIGLSELYGAGSGKKEAAGSSADAEPSVAQPADKAPASISYTEAYGKISEAESIIADIAAGGRAYDDCVIACADSSYYQIFYDISKRYGIPMSFGSGVPILDSCPARLLKLIYDWKGHGYSGIDSLRAMITSDSFDRTALAETVGSGPLGRKELDEFIVLCGSLRLSFDSAENAKRLAAYRALHGGEDPAAFDPLTAAERFSEILAGGISAFLRRFSVIRAGKDGRDGNVDRAALNVITEILDSYAAFVPDGDPADMIPDILTRSVCSEISRAGALHVCSISGAMSCPRKLLCVCGLSADGFPGSPSEDYLLLDSDLSAFAEGADPYSSAGRIETKKAQFFALIGLARALREDIWLSYSDFGLSDLKDRNPSSVLFELYEREHPGASIDELAAAMKRVGLFDAPLSPSRGAGKAYSAGAEFPGADISAALVSGQEILDRPWAPTALEVFFQCPCRFYLSRVLRIPEPEEDDPFEVISAKDRGTLAHSLMELLKDRGMPSDAFRAAAEKAFDEFLIERPPVHQGDAAREKQDFVRMMMKAYDQDMELEKEVLSSETKYSFEHPSGVRLFGFPDRLERLKDGSCIIGDFKTKRRIEHHEDDIDSCLQVVIYAWLCEQAGFKVSRGEYRYLRLGRSVPCAYDGAMKDRLSEKLESFKLAAQRGEFHRDPGDDSENCRYCGFADICEDLEKALYGDAEGASGDAGETEAYDA